LGIKLVAILCNNVFKENFVQFNNDFVVLGVEDVMLLQGHIQSALTTVVLDKNG